MNVRPAFFALVLASQLPLTSAQDTSHAVGVIDQTVATVTLGSPEPIITILPVAAPAPVDVRPGTTLRLQVGIPIPPDASIEWRKNDQHFPTSGPSFEIPAASVSDSGVYYAVVRSGNLSATTTTVTIRVFSTEHRRLLGLSSRTTISSENRMLISGFVIESGSNTGSGKPVLIRAVGPSLATLGVSRPLAQPVLRLFLPNGGDWDEQPHPAVWPFGPLETTHLSRIAGTFPFLPNTADVARAFVLPPGPYTVHVTSANGSAGDVLLEIYELPEAVLRAPWTYLQSSPGIPMPPPAPSGSAPASAPPGVGISPPVDLPPISPEGSGL